MDYTTKKELAEALAACEISVALGQQTERYWINQYMRDRREALVDRVQRYATLITDPKVPGRFAPVPQAAQDRVVEMALGTM